MRRDVEPPFPTAAALLMAGMALACAWLAASTVLAQLSTLRTLAGALAVSHVGGLLLLGPDRTRGLGAAIGFGTALVALLPFVFFGGLTILASGLGGSPANPAPVLLLIAFDLALVVVGLHAVREQQATVETWSWGVLAPLGLMIALGMMIAAADDPYVGPPNESVSPPLEERVSAVAQCLDDLRSEGRAYPANRGELLNSCLSAKRLQRMLYLPARPAPDGAIAAFSLCVGSANDHTGSRHSTVIDDRGIWSQPSAAPPARSCAAAWGSDPSGVLHCAFAYASRFPEKGFPAALSELGPEGIDCLPFDTLVTTGTDSVANKDYLMTYLAAERDTAGRIAGFTISATSFNRDLPSMIVDETGVWRHTFGRDARLDDPPLPRR